MGFWISWSFRIKEHHNTSGSLFSWGWMCFCFFFFFGRGPREVPELQDILRIFVLGLPLSGISVDSLAHYFLPFIMFHSP